MFYKTIHMYYLKKSHNLLKKKNQGIITENPTEVWPVCTLPTRGSKLITLPT